LPSWATQPTNHTRIRHTKATNAISEVINLLSFIVLTLQLFKVFQRVGALDTKNGFAIQGQGPTARFFKQYSVTELSKAKLSRIALKYIYFILQKTTQFMSGFAS
jgi:hypothetical protein